MKKLLLFAAISIIFACKKEPKEVVNTINYHCFAEGNSGFFKYVNSDGSWITTPLSNHTLDLTVKVRDSDMGFVPQVYSTGPDSLFIGADGNGKHVENKRRNTIGNSNVSVNLNDLK